MRCIGMGAVQGKSIRPSILFQLTSDVLFVQRSKRISPQGPCRQTSSSSLSTQILVALHAEERFLWPVPASNDRKGSVMTSENNTETYPDSLFFGSLTVLCASCSTKMTQRRTLPAKETIFSEWIFMQEILDLASLPPTKCCGRPREMYCSHCRIICCRSCLVLYHWHQEY